MAKLSICVPAYEEPEGIRRLLESAAAQRYPNIEVIVTDDSTSPDVEDAVKEAVAKYGPRLPIRYVRNDPRKGAVPNWNAALALAEGDYVQLLHHDDAYSSPESASRFVALMESSGADLVFSGTYQVEGEEKKARHISPEDAARLKEDPRDLFLGNTIGAPSAVMLRRSFLTEKGIRYDEALTWLVDMDYYLQVLTKGGQFAYTEEPLVSIGISGSQLTNRCIDDAELNVRERAHIYEKFDLGAAGEKYARAYLDVAASFGVPKRELPDAPRIPDGDRLYRRARLRAAEEKAGRYLDSARYLWEKLRKKLERPTEFMFYIGFFMELLIVLLDKSAYAFPYASQAFRVSFALFALRALCVPRESKEKLFFAGAVLLGILCWRLGGKNEILRGAVFLAALRGEPVRRVMKWTLAAYMAGCGILMLLSTAGLFGTFAMRQDFGHGEELRYALGMGHPNAAHCMLMVTILLVLYLMGGRMHWYSYLFAFLANGLLYFLTRSNTAAFTVAFALCLSFLAHRPRFNKGRGWIYGVFPATLSVGLLFSVLAAVVGDRWAILRRLDVFLTGRIASLWESTFHDGTLATWTLFGDRADRVYFDLGMVRYIYWYGAATALITVVLLFMLGRQIRWQRDAGALVLGTAVLLYTILEAHFVSFYLGRAVFLPVMAAYVPSLLRLTEGKGKHAA